MTEDYFPAVLLPDESYALRWVEVFRTAYPELKDRAREIFLSLAGYATWKSMVEACSLDVPTVIFDNLSAEVKLARCSRMRELLVKNYGMRLDVANHISWTNAPGNDSIWDVFGPEYSALETDVSAVYRPTSLGKLDEQNLGRCKGTPQGLARLNNKPPIGAHLGLLNRLTWNFVPIANAPSQVSQLNGSEQEYAEPIGFVIDHDLGRVPIFVTSCCPAPGVANDQVYNQYLESALVTTELLNGIGAPALVLHEWSTSRNHEGKFFSCFGSLVYNDTFRDLFLTESSTSLSEVFVQLVSTHFGTPGFDQFADNDLRLQKMFERARQKACLPEGDSGMLFRTGGANGWSELTLVSTEASLSGA